jgi:membrane-bound lytic murein transglycosylase B
MAKTRRRLLKQFAIFDASAKIAFSPEIRDFFQNQIVQALTTRIEVKTKRRSLTV